MPFILGTLAAPAMGQGLSIPPRQDATSPGGVSYTSGSFTHNVRDLSIGGDFPAGLTLERTYISNVGYDSLGSIGWVHNWSGRITVEAAKLDPDSPLHEPGRMPYIFNVSVGGRSAGFTGGSHFSALPFVPTGQPQGTYAPISPTGASLEYTGTSPTNGHYIFTDSDGSVINFLDHSQPQRIDNWTLPDGTTLVFGYHSSGELRSVISNRGYAILFDPPTSSGDRKVCAINLTQHVVTATSTCPSGVQSATYSYTAASGNSAILLLTGATDATNQTTTYGYSGTGAFGSPTRVSCITPPGQSSCQIQNTYTICQEWDESTQQWFGASAYVIAQQAATGESYAYTYSFPGGDPMTDKCAGKTSQLTTMTVNSTATTTIMPTGSVPYTVTDPLNRTTTFGYMMNAGTGWANEPGELTEVTQPLGNSVVNGYDTRGNITSQTTSPVPSSTLDDRVSTAVFPTSCSSTTRRTCNKPTSVTDVNGTTEYTYDDAHGGVLREWGPAPTSGAPRPQTRHSYAQRYAWIAASGGGYVQAATPVWVRTATSICRTSGADTTGTHAPCSVANDEVRTEYDYGPNSGPNNLLLRGETVTSTDGGVTTTLRTCYTYDTQGNRISTTTPNGTATLTSCP